MEELTERDALNYLVENQITRGPDDPRTALQVLAERTQQAAIVADEAAIAINALRN